MLSTAEEIQKWPDSRLNFVIEAGERTNWDCGLNESQDEIDIYVSNLYIERDQRLKDDIIDAAGVIKYAYFKRLRSTTSGSSRFCEGRIFRVSKKRNIEFFTKLVEPRGFSISTQEEYNAQRGLRKIKNFGI